MEKPTQLQILQARRILMLDDLAQTESRNAEDIARKTQDILNIEEQIANI